MTDTTSQPKKLKAMDLFLGIIILMLFLDSGTASSALGISSITWYLILAVIFFLPMALITSELGSTYPSDGGLYHWIKISLGADNATRVSWYYWLNCAIWTASMGIFVMDVICQMLTVLTGIEVPFYLYLGLSCIVIWVLIFMTMQPANESTFARNLGGIAKLVIVGAMFICAGCYLVIHGGQTATPFSVSELKPSIGAAFAFFPALIYNLIGFDGICSIGGSNIKNPGKDLPRMILLSLVLMLGIYILFTLAMCIVTPMAEIDIINGILNMFTITFPGTFGTVLYILFGFVFLYALISQGPAWLQAASFMAMEAASDENRELPKIFATTTKKGGPLGSSLIMGIIGTSLIIIYGLLTAFAGGAATDLFWTLFSFVSLIFLIPFIMCCSAFIKLRKTDAGTKRAFRFPGSDGFGTFAARFCQIIIIFTMILFFWVPGQPVDIITDIALGIGFVIGLILGEVFNIKRKKALKQQQ